MPDSPAVPAVATISYDDFRRVDVRVGTVLGTVKLADYERYNPQHLPPSQFAPDGTVLRQPVSDSEILGTFADAWRIAPGASLLVQAMAGELPNDAGPDSPSPDPNAHANADTPFPLDQSRHSRRFFRDG